MAQRNPMNQRYQGDGPGGQTRKSASSAKPATSAAASVKVKTKPSTSAEKKAAENERMAKMQKKADERKRKADRANRARLQAELDTRLAAGEITDSEAEQLLVEAEAEKPKKKKLFAGQTYPEGTLQADPEYRKWRRVYWTSLSVGIVSVIASIALVALIPTRNWIGVMMLTYLPVVYGMYINLAKIRPITERYQRGGSGKPSPKQAKHIQAARSQAEQLEASRKAEKAARTRNRRS